MKKEGSDKPFRKTDEKQTAAGKTQRHSNLITFFRTSSTITVQLPPQITMLISKLSTATALLQ